MEGIILIVGLRLSHKKISFLSDSAVAGTQSNVPEVIRLQNVPLRWACRIDFSLVRGFAISIGSTISSPPMRTRNSVSIVRPVFSFLALLPLLFASCSVLFVSPYELEGTRRTLRIVGHLLDYELVFPQSSTLVTTKPSGI
jgi:hypothetical protein